MGTKSGRELLPGTLDLLILNSLTNGHMHGYGISRFLQRMSDDFFHVEEGTLYPALQRLQLNGYIDGIWENTVNNRRARFYRLTKAGKKHLADEMNRYRQTTLAIDKILGVT